jgi:hypothetical protein
MSEHCPHCGGELAPAKKGKQRSVPQHKRYFAMIRAAFSHWPESHRFQPLTEERLRKWLQAKAGYAVIKTVNTDGMTKDQAVLAIAAELSKADPVHFTSASAGNFYIISSKSIDFDTLPHIAACALFDHVAEVIEAETDLKVAQILPPISEKRGRMEHAEVPL